MVDVSNLPALEFWLKIVNYGYIVALTLTVGFSAIMYYLNSRVNAIKDNKAKVEKAKNDSSFVVHEASIMRDSLEIEKSKLELQKALEETQKIKLKSVSLEQKNLELAVNLEREKSNRLKIEEELAPRSLEQYLSSQKLNKFKNKTAIIRFIPDWEAQRFAGMIRAMLNMAGWKIKDEHPEDVRMIRDGVTIESKNYPLPDKELFADDETWEWIKSNHKFNEIDELINIFKENRIYVRHYLTDYPDDVIIITVGLKPNKFKQERGGIRDNISY